MDMPSEPPRCPEEKRPHSCKFVELHVLYVPNDQWNVQLNKVPVEAIQSFASGGFIRIHPDVTLKSLRRKLAALLSGTLGAMDNFFFLKCVGHSLALVKSKQEQDVKVKTFAPPYAPQPELYLLRVVESDSLTPDSSTSSDHSSCYSPKDSPAPAGPERFVRFPPCVPVSPQQATPAAGPQEQKRERGSSSSEAGSPQKASDNKPDWAEMTERGTPPRLCSPENNGLKKLQADSTSYKNKRQSVLRQRAARDSGVAESLEDRQSDFSLPDWLLKSKESYADTDRTQRKKPVMDSPPTSSHITTSADKDPKPLSFRTNKQELIEEIKLMREEKKQLEWMRQELLRKGKDLLAQNRHRRNQARDSWKKKYFETKKATAPLEESLRNARQELETFYSKLLHQLQARKDRHHPKRPGRASVKNELIIQIMTECSEIDDLRRKVEDAKMKLQTEIQLRKQAATELRSLKAELAQKKSQSPPRWTAPRSGFGDARRTKHTPR